MNAAFVDWAALRAAATRATENSYSPYSGFPVGAAGLLADGTVITAANVENASYVAGICAETALVGVLVAGGGGRGDLVAVAVTDPGGRRPRAVRPVPAAPPRDGRARPAGERATDGRAPPRCLRPRRPDVST